MPKILTWSFGVQRELRSNSTIEVRYLGTRGLELPVQYRRNFTSYFDGGGTPLPTYLNASTIPTTYTASTPTDTNFYNFQPNLYAKYGFNGIVTLRILPLGSSIYHAGSVEFKQRAGHGLTFDANYTYSHTLDDCDQRIPHQRFEPTNERRIRIISARTREIPTSMFRTNFAFSLAYYTPKVTTENRLMRALLSSYVFGSSFIAQSGQPVTLQSGVDSNGNGDSAGDRVVFNPAGIGNTGSDVFPVCESTAGSASVGADWQTCAWVRKHTLRHHLTGARSTRQRPAALVRSGYWLYAIKWGAKYIVAGGGARTTAGRTASGRRDSILGMCPSAGTFTLLSPSTFRYRRRYSTSSIIQTMRLAMATCSAIAV